MASTTSSGVSIEDLIEALGRLTTTGQRPPTADEAKVVGHFTDLVAFLGRDNVNVPFEFVPDGDDVTIDLIAPTGSASGSAASPIGAGNPPNHDKTPTK